MTTYPHMWLLLVLLEFFSSRSSLLDETVYSFYYLDVILLHYTRILMCLVTLSCLSLIVCIYSYKLNVMSISVSSLPSEKL